MRTHGIGRCQCLAAPVLQEVQINLLLPLGRVSFQTGDLRQFPMREARDNFGELTRLIVAAATTQGNIYMQAGFPGRLAIVFRAGRIQHLANRERCIDDCLKRDVLRIQINDKEVGLLEHSQARAPRIDLDAAQVGHVHERGGVLTKQKPNLFVLRFGANGHRLDPLRVMLDVLLVKALALNTVGVAVQRLRTILQVRQDEGRHLVVVSHQVAFGELFLRPVNLVEVCQLHGPAID